MAGLGRGAAIGALRLLVLAGGFAYLVAVLMLGTLQSKLVYFPTREIESTPAQIGLRFEDVWFAAEDGVRLHGWWVPASDSRGTILFLHGNAGNISHRLPSIRTFHALGYHTLIFDYRGYGRSAGHPSEQGTYRDAEAAWRYLLREREIAPSDIVLFGRSLGGAIAASLAETHTPRALILESTFTSVPDLGAELYPFLPVRLLARIRYDTLARLPQVRCPVLIVHSRDDEIIPSAHGRRLWEAAPEPKHFLEIEGGHNDGFVISEPEYGRGLAAFLSRYDPRSDHPAPPRG